MLKREELQKEMAARFGMWLDENLGTYDDSYTTAEVVTEAILNMGENVIRPKGRDYPHMSRLVNSMFYLDEAFVFDESPGHEESNSCDTCDRPAEYMTFGSDDQAYYICKECIKLYGLEHKIEKEDDGPHTSFGECDTCGRMDILNAGLCESCVYSIQ